MKKLLIVICMMLGIAGTPIAQTTPSKKVTKKETRTKATTSAGPLKKNGTPDMRYKANKDAAKAKGPLKKDGTPDMRYKANKDAAKTN